MSNGHYPSSGEPSPREVLYAVRQALFDNSRLKGGAPTQEIAEQLVVGGYLPTAPSLALVEEMLKVLEEGSHGLRSPTLQPCSLEYFWDAEAGRLNRRMDLSMSIEWIGAPSPWRDRTVPEKLTHAKTPPCTDLISDPGEVLRNRNRLPIHLCVEEFMRQSTELWAEAHQFEADTVNVHRWASKYPLPIGRRALLQIREVDDPSEWSEVLNVLPFEGDERAMWALRVEVREDTLDLFGLEDYPSEFHKEFGISVAGDLACVLRGRGASLTDLLHNADRWWSHFRGRALQGRPRGSGIWEDADEYRVALSEAVQTLRAHGYKPTQERVAEPLSCDDRVLRYWNDRFGVRWADILKAT
jgi:hypothetical protein